MKVSLKIKITKEFKIQLSLLDEEKKESIIVETIPSITFNLNTINICDQNQNSIYFFKKWIENPENYSTY